MMKVRSILFMTMLTLAQVAPARCEGTGGDATALVVQSNSTVSYRTYEIPYFVAQVSKINMGPLDREERLYVMPLVDIVRDIDGRPVVMMNSPETGGRLVLNGIRYETPEELALAVEDGTVDPNTPIAVRLQFTFSVPRELKLAVYKAAKGDFGYDRVSCQDFTRLYVENGGTELSNLVGRIPPRRVKIVCRNPGLEQVEFALEDNTTLGDTMSISSKQPVPARFVCWLLNPTSGVDFHALLYSGAYRQGEVQAKIVQILDEICSNIVKELGDGGMKIETSNGAGVDFHVLAQREQCLEVIRRSGYRERIAIIGDPDAVDSLWEKLEKGYLDIMAVAEDDVSDFFLKNLRWLEMLREPSTVELLQRMSNDHDLTETDRSAMKHLLSTLSEHTQGGGGISIPKIISLGGGGGKWKEGANLSQEKTDDYYRHMAQCLNNISVNGFLKLPAELDLVLVNTKKLERDVRQDIIFHTDGPLTTIALAFDFSSDIPSVPDPLDDPVFDQIVETLCREGQAPRSDK